MTRRESREHLFCVLFQMNFHEQDQLNEICEMYFADKSLKKEELRQEILDKASKVLSMLSDIDKKIEENAKGWKISRIGKAELTILRIGVYEALYDEEIDVAVAVNEAVELSKKYGEDRAPSFVNGILGNVVNG